MGRNSVRPLHDREDHDLQPGHRRHIHGRTVPAPDYPAPPALLCGQGDDVANGGAQTVGVVNVDIEKTATGRRHHLLGQRHGSGEPGPVISTTSSPRWTWNEKLRPSPRWPNPLANGPVATSSMTNSDPLDCEAGASVIPPP